MHGFFSAALKCSSINLFLNTKFQSWNLKNTKNKFIFLAKVFKITTFLLKITIINYF